MPRGRPLPKSSVSRGEDGPTSYGARIRRRSSENSTRHVASISPFPRDVVSSLYYILDYKYIIYPRTITSVCSDRPPGPYRRGQAKAARDMRRVACQGQHVEKDHRD